MAKDKYIVWKLEDVISTCTQAELQNLGTIVDRILRKREVEGKKPSNSYIVVNCDEPYIDEIRDVLKRHGDWD